MSNEVIVTACTVLTLAGSIVFYALKKSNSEGADKAIQEQQGEDIKVLMLARTEELKMRGRQDAYNEERSRIDTDHGQRLYRAEERLGLVEGREQGRREGR